MAPRTKTIGSQILTLAEDYTAANDALTDRVVANTTAAARDSLNGMQGDLRRFYNSFLDVTIPDSLTDQGDLRRPLEYSIAQATARHADLLKISQGFLPDSEIAALQGQYEADFAKAIGLGGELQARLAKLVDPKRATPFGGPDPTVVQAAADRTSAFIRGEAMAFREGLTRVTLDGVNSGKGFRAIEQDVRTLLTGATDPGGLPLGNLLKPAMEAA
jgi:hypothetical protein